MVDTSFYVPEEKRDRSGYGVWEEDDEGKLEARSPSEQYAARDARGVRWWWIGEYGSGFISGFSQMLLNGVVSCTVRVF